MASKATQDDIINFNELYIKYKTYSQVARETGFSATTVKKYIVKDYVPQSKIERIEFTQDMLPDDINFEIFKNKDDWGDLCILSEEEKDGVKGLWMELSL